MKTFVEFVPSKSQDEEFVPQQVEQFNQPLAEVEDPGRNKETTSITGKIIIASNHNHCMYLMQ